MLDLELIVNVVIGIFAYKGMVAIIEFACLKLLALLLNKQIKGMTRRDRIDKAIKEMNKAIDAANEELKKTQLN